MRSASRKRSPWVVAWLVLFVATSAQAAEPPALAKARMLYNAGSYDEAIEAAMVARKLPQASDAAALVMARALLEKYRQSETPSDLSDARDLLAAVHSAVLTPRDQVDLLIGLGQSLYLAETYGAAAELFDVALTSPVPIEERDRSMLLEWWATAIDRDAQSRPPERRGHGYERISQRMEQELRRDPGSAPANYWLVVAARGAGDLDVAWTEAIAGWVRATLSPQSAAGLRADLDRLVMQALIPERVRNRPAREQPDATAALRAEWDGIKMQWKGP